METGFILKGGTDRLLECSTWRAEVIIDQWKDQLDPQHPQVWSSSFHLSFCARVSVFKAWCWPLLCTAVHSVLSNHPETLSKQWHIHQRVKSVTTTYDYHSKKLYKTVDSSQYQHFVAFMCDWSENVTEMNVSDLISFQFRLWNKKLYEYKFISFLWCEYFTFMNASIYLQSHSSIYLETVSNDSLKLYVYH